MALKKTKIVCTIGPSCEKPETIAKMLEAGMNVARFNFSHGDHEEKRHQMNVVKEGIKISGIQCAFLLDTKGPEIRTGVLKDNKKIMLETGKDIILTADEVEGTTEKISISYKMLPKEVKVGTLIYIADGVLGLEVKSVKGNDIHCAIKVGGELGNRKNVNVVGVKTSLPAMGERDEADLVMGVKEGVDFVAASFIRKPSDVITIRKHLDKNGGQHVKIISKIEDEEGLENIEEIIRVSDGVMVARGDLGVQIKIEDIPLAQKRIIELANTANKPVITATQMLDSMIKNPRPTRAEVNDVANAIFDGTDAVMLSGETANGDFPLEAVEVMSKVCLAVECSNEYIEKAKNYFNFHKSSNNIADAVAKAGFVVATDINASAIITPTKGGTTPKLISKYRPTQTIVAATTSDVVARQLLLSWGVYPILAKMANDSDHMINNALKTSLEKNLIKNFDKVVILAGVPISSPIMLNMVKVHLVCNVLNKGVKGFGGMVSGKIVKAENVEAAKKVLKNTGNEILLTKILDNSFKTIINNVKGVIVEETSEISHDELKKLNPELVFISEVPEAYDKFEEGLVVTLDSEERSIYEGVIAK